MKKQYNAGAALDPGQERQQDNVLGEMDYKGFVEQLPKEFQKEIEEALAALLSYIHSDEGTSMVFDNLQNGGEDIAAQIGISALQAMDAADPDQQWSDSAKVFCGYFGVREVSNLAREAGLVDISEEEETEIFQIAAQNYIHALIAGKPTQEEREAEAIRIQKEVEPLMSEEQRRAGMEAARREGIPMGEDGQPQQGGLLQ